MLRHGQGGLLSGTFMPVEGRLRISEQKQPEQSVLMLIFVFLRAPKVLIKSIHVLKDDLIVWIRESIDRAAFSPSFARSVA